MVQTESILAVEDLDVHYGGSRILRDVSLGIPNGSIAAIMGRNGVGKTTLLKAIMGLLEPILPDYGLDDSNFRVC